MAAQQNHCPQAKGSITSGYGHYGYSEDIRKLYLAYQIAGFNVAVPLKPAAPSDPDYGLVPRDPSDLDRQAKVYGAVFRVALPSKNCPGVQTWGFSDSHSWIPGFSRGRNGTALMFDKG